MAKIVIIINGVRKEVNLGDKAHLDSQRTYKHTVTKDKTKYTRKQKHKGIKNID